MAPVNPRVVMLGPSPAAGASGAADAVDAYRAHGLFKRWPIDYLATCAGGGVRSEAVLALGALRRFAARLADADAAVVHLHVEAAAGFWRDAAFAGIAIAARRPLLVHLHGGRFAHFYEGAGAVGRAAIRGLLGRAAHVVVPCEAMRTWVHGVARGVRAVCVTPPVVPHEAAPEHARPNLVLYFARLEAAKGIYDLLEALAGVRSAVPDVRLVCAGDGERAAVARYAEGLGIADIVRFTGWTGPSGKRALLESAAVFALPSYDEGLPTRLLEAMAAGVPVIASPVGGVPEVLADGVSGFLAAPGDVATLQRLLRKLLLDRALAARVGAAARESVRLRCAPERALARLGDLYAALGVPAPGESPEPLQDPRAPKAAA